MAQSRPRPQSQDPSVSASFQSAGALQASGFGVNHQLTNYSLLFQQQTKQSEEVYALKFQLRQVESELDKQKALHKQDSMQLKNRITDILEQKQKSQQINDMLINSLRSAIQNQSHSKAHMLEFDYVCDMVRMYSNQENRRKSSFFQQNAAAGGNETSLESVIIDTIECRTTGCQTIGEPWQQANLTFTPKEKDLVEKLQQLEKLARDSRSAKEKQETHKNEFAIKVKELTALVDQQKSKMVEGDRDTSELQNKIEELMKNAADQVQEKQQQNEFKHLYESLQVKYSKKKRSAKDRKHNQKYEITSLKRQLADTLQKAFNFSEENTQLKRFQSQMNQPQQKIISRKQFIQENSDQILLPNLEQVLHTDRDKNGSEKDNFDTENVETTAEGRRVKAESPNQMTCNVSQFLRAPPASTSKFESSNQINNDPSNLQTTGELSTREQVNPTRAVKNRRSSQKVGKGGRYNQNSELVEEFGGEQSDIMKYQNQSSFLQLHLPDKIQDDDDADNSSSSLLIPNNPRVQPTGIPAVGGLKLNKAFLSERQEYKITRQEPLSERTINTDQQTPQLKSHAKLFSKFINISKNESQPKIKIQNNDQQQNSFINSGFATHNTDLLSPQSLCLIGSAVHQNATNLEISRANYDDEIVIHNNSNKFQYENKHNQQKHHQKNIKSGVDSERLKLDLIQDNEMINILEDSLERNSAAVQGQRVKQHQKQMTTVTQNAQFQQHNILHEESNDQLVRIEASPETNRKIKNKRKKKQSSQIRISPIKPNTNNNQNNGSPNRHRSPCQHENAPQGQQRQLLSLAPVAQIDISRPINKHKKQAAGIINHKSSSSLTSGQRYLRANQKQQQNEENHRNGIHNGKNLQDSQMLMEDGQQLSESRSCSIEHHNMSSSSIEGMIKFGLTSSQYSHRRQQNQKIPQTHRHQNNANPPHQQRSGAGTGYRSPQQTHKYNNPLDRSKSPNGMEREQIGSIIDDITDQLKAAEVLNYNRRSSLGFITGSDAESDGIAVVVEVSPRNNMLKNGETMFCQTQRVHNQRQGKSDNNSSSGGDFNHQRQLIGGHLTQRDDQNHFGFMNNKSSHEQINNQTTEKHSNGSNRRQFLTRDALINDQTTDRTHTTNGGTCTHYHNHYESNSQSRPNNTKNNGEDAMVSERLIRQCFDKIGQSLDQLANKDMIIQRLISDNYATDKKKSGLRKKLKALRQTLQDCNNNGGKVQEEDQQQQVLLYEANTNLSFENEHLKDKVQKTQNLLKMYQLDSPLQKGDSLMNRSSSNYDLESLRKMARMSFQVQKKPCKKKQKQQQQHQQVFDNTTTSLRMPLTDRNQQTQQIQTAQNDTLAMKRQELFRSMVNAGKGDTSTRKHSEQGEKTQTMKVQKSQSREKLRNNAFFYNQSQTMMGSDSNHKFSSTQKLGGFLTARNGQTTTDEIDTRCESNDAQSNRRHAKQFNNTQAMQNALKMNVADLNSSQSLQFSQDFIARQKQVMPDRCRDGFLKASNHHIANQRQKQEQTQINKQPELIKSQRKSQRTRYEEVDEDDCEVERQSVPSYIIEEFSGREETDDPETQAFQPHKITPPQQLQSAAETLQDVGDYDLPSQVIASSTHQLEMNQNNLNQMHGRQLVVQAFNKVLVIQNQRQNTQDAMMQQSYQSENDESRVVYDYVNNAAAQFRGVQHPKKHEILEQSPTIGEDSDATQPDDFFQGFNEGSYQDKSMPDSRKVLMKKAASPRNYYYNHN